MRMNVGLVYRIYRVGDDGFVMIRQHMDEHGVTDMFAR